jgi:hypothetical protein
MKVSNRKMESWILPIVDGTSPSLSYLGNGSELPRYSSSFRVGSTCRSSSVTTRTLSK